MVLNKREVYNLMKDRNGPKKGLTKLEILFTLVPEYTDLDMYQRYYLRKKVGTIISQLRKEDFFLVPMNDIYFVPTKYEHTYEYRKKCEMNIEGTRKNLEKLDKFLKKQKPLLQVIRK
ncbi:MAG: hypothetical protein ACOC22_00655 [bacterium]